MFVVDKSNRGCSFSCIKSLSEFDMASNFKTE